MAAGLAGGSSDAAATLDGALEAWDAELDPDARLATAARLGSDVPFFLAGGPALVEGRGEQVAPLHGLHGSPGVLLVTPAIAVSTAEVFDVFDGLGGRGNEATRMSSGHLAEELRSGLSAADLVARAGVLTVANDLPQAALVLVPALVPFRRALSRLLARPIGLSGSGPTLWALYPSEAEAAVAADAVRVALRDGRLSAPDRRLRSSPPPRFSAAVSRGGNHDPPGSLDDRGTGRHRSVQPGASSPTVCSSRPARPPSIRRPGSWSRAASKPRRSG